jgi:hypothetical protein
MTGKEEEYNHNNTIDRNRMTMAKETGRILKELAILLGH